jgi:tetratricopeptide (TPR) repeat protein
MIRSLDDCNFGLFAGQLAAALYLFLFSTIALAQHRPAADNTIRCQPELDAIVAALSNVQETAPLQRRLQALDIHCPHLPQISHNLGVLAAREQNWPEAIAYLEKSLALDRRAAMTHQHLQQIFKYRAARAYARALNKSDPQADTLEQPVLELQGSDVENADAQAGQLDTSQFHTISTVEYELYAWWQAIQLQRGVAEHYVDDYPETAITLAQREYAGKQWTDFQREIAFTANDVVVVLSDTEKHRTLILMRLVGTRWKIYQETVL